MEGKPLEDTGPPEMRIDLPVDAHLPDSYIADQELRLEAYRRLAAATIESDVSDVAAEWVDRYGPLPAAAVALIELAQLRVEAIRVGVVEIVKLRHEIRISPVDLKPSQEVRLKRLQPRSVLQARDGVLFIPADEPLVENLVGFIGEMWKT